MWDINFLLKSSLNIIISIQPLIVTHFMLKSLSKCGPYQKYATFFRIEILTFSSAEVIFRFRVKGP